MAAPALRPAYLIHGEDHSAVRERRVRLTRLAREHEGALSLERYDGPRATPKEAAAALGGLALGGWRVVLFDGVERWRGKEVGELLAPLANRFPAQTTLACFAYEEGRSQAPRELAEFVRAAGGQVLREPVLRGEQLLRWARREAQRLGATLPEPLLLELCERFGARRGRLVRELERLAVAEGEGKAGESEEAGRSPFAFLDAVVAGDGAQAVACAGQLLRQGERPLGLIHLLAGRLRAVQELAVGLAEGRSAAQLRRGLRLPDQPAHLAIAAARRLGPLRVGRALAVLADLEAQLLGAPALGEPAPRRASLEEETLFLRGCLAVARLLR